MKDSRNFLLNVLCLFFLILIPFQIEPSGVHLSVVSAVDESYPGDIFVDTVWGIDHIDIEDEIWVDDHSTLTMEGGDHTLKNNISVQNRSKIIFKEGNYTFAGQVDVNFEGQIILEKGNYIFERDVTVSNSSRIYIQPGVHIIFKNVNGYTPSFYIDDSLIEARGTADERITFSSVDADVIDFRIILSGVLGTLASSFDFVDFIGGGMDRQEIPVDLSLADVFVNTAHANTMSDGIATLVVSNGRVRVSHSIFEKGNFFAVDVRLWIAGSPSSMEQFLDISDTDFVNNRNHFAVRSNIQCRFGTYEECSSLVSLINNWYDSSDGPKTDDHPERNGDFVSNFAYISNWSVEPHFPKRPPVSNVLFLPGFKASRLYQGNDQLWPPNYFGNDLEDLALNEDGTSQGDVYTKDVIEEVALPFIGSNIYKSFLEKLANLKSDGVMNDFEAFPYDWRRNVEDIATTENAYADGEMKLLVDEVQRLSQNSKSDRVTIIAHSNGGLVAKALMIQLEELGLSDKVDKIIFVASPQMGTPIALLSLLYGFDESALFGTLISQAESRKLAENMPGAYSFLPSQKYFDRIIDPFVNFNVDKSRYKDFKTFYGENIDTANEFSDFLLAKLDKRVKPDQDDINAENILNEQLLDQAKAIHSRIDNWSPPANVEVLQIAGWGIDTVSGVTYNEKEDVHCYAVNGSIPSCTGQGTYMGVFDPIFTVDGDGVVVSPSAVMMEETEKIKKYWVDLYRSNGLMNIGRKHKDILEVDALQNFLSDILTHSVEDTSLPTFIKTSRPSDYANARTRLRMSLYSPLDIIITDEDGRQTGLASENIDGKKVFEQNIPNSYYMNLGERKYVGFEGGQDIKVLLKGYELGSYTLKLEEIKETETGEEIVSKAMFANLPTTADTEVAFDIPATGLSDMSPVSADIDGDGTNEYVVHPVIGGVAFLDQIAPTTEMKVDAISGTNGWLTSDAVVSFSAVDNEGGSGVDMIQYSIDNGEHFAVYENPITLSEEGEHLMKYFAIDKIGNKEVVKNAVVKIDKTAPDAKFAFNSVSRRLEISGQDTLSKSVAVETIEYLISREKKDLRNEISEKKEDSGDEDHSRVKMEKTLTTTLTDEAGNTEKVIFEEKQEKSGRIEMKFLSIIRGDMTYTPLNATLHYEWVYNEKRKKIIVFNTEIELAGEKIETHFISKQNITRVTSQQKGSDDENDEKKDVHELKKQEWSGMIIPSLVTKNGILNISYE